MKSIAVFVRLLGPGRREPRTICASKIRRRGHVTAQVGVTTVTMFLLLLTRQDHSFRIRSAINRKPGSGPVTWTLHYTKQAQKDAKKLASSGLKAKAQSLLAIIEKDPWQNPPPFEKLVGDLNGAYSRRINIQHRLVYQVLEAERAVKILRLWTHYE